MMDFFSYISVRVEISNQIKSNQIKSNQIKSNQIKSLRYPLNLCLIKYELYIQARDGKNKVFWVFFYLKPTKMHSNS